MTKSKLQQIQQYNKYDKNRIYITKNTKKTTKIKYNKNTIQKYNKHNKNTIYTKIQ